mgnify:CR=1 FL=1
MIDTQLNIMDIIGSSGVDLKVDLYFNPPLETRPGWCPVPGVRPLGVTAPDVAALQRGGGTKNGESKISIVPLQFTGKTKRVFMPVVPVIGEVFDDGFDPWRDRGRYWNEWAVEDTVLYVCSAAFRGCAGRITETLRSTTVRMGGDARISGQSGSRVSGVYKGAERYGCGYHVVSVLIRGARTTQHPERGREPRPLREPPAGR